jgi:radical SAM protein
MPHGDPTAARPLRHAPRDYARTPLNVYWEMTQACALACRHCRAGAMPEPHPGQLTPEESMRFVRQLAEFGDPPPQLVLTGGDPLLRPDLFELIDEARALGIPVAITPAATPLLTADVLARLKEHGIDALGLSLDGSTAARHEAIRGVPGCFDLTMHAMTAAGGLGLPLQVNTLVTAETAADLPATYALLRGYPVTRWSLFFLIPVGRGRVLEPLPPAEGEALMRWMYAVSREAPFLVATTEAPSYRRVALEEMRAAGMTPEEIQRSGIVRGFGVRDGNGILFVANTGEICPAGFLPLEAGNVRTDHVVTVYRDAPLFRALRDPHRFAGKCGRCEYAGPCGGSRARAWVATGDPLGSDPFCPYEPRVAS